MYYVKAGQALFTSIRNYAANKINPIEMLNQESVQMLQQQNHLNSELKNQENFTEKHTQQQSSFYHSGKSDKSKEIKSIESSKGKRDYGFLPEMNLNFDKKTASVTGQEDDGKKKYQILSQDQVRQLRKDLGIKRFTKPQLLTKYKISNSTLMRYIQRFQQLPESVTWSKKRRPQNYDYISENSQRVGRSRKKDYYEQMEQQQLKKSQLYGQLESQSKTSSVNKIQGNSLTNLHVRYLFMKQLKKLDLNRVIFIDQLFFWKLTGETSESRGTFLHPEHGYVKQIHFVLAMADTQLIHWKLKPKRLTGQQFYLFFQEIVEKAKDYTFIMDNHSIHKTEAIKNKIQKDNVKVCYLPSCSKQLNPITFFYEEFKRRLQPRLRNNFPIDKLLNSTHNMLKQMSNQSDSDGFFSKSEDYWKMAEKKQMFPIN